MINSISTLFGIPYPIFQGGMAWVSDASLASAVSQAGGLGIIAAANAPVEYVQGEIKKLRKKTDKPFGVNIMLMSPYAEEIAQLVDTFIEVGAGKTLSNLVSKIVSDAVVLNVEDERSLVKTLEVLKNK